MVRAVAIRLLAEGERSPGTWASELIQRETVAQRLNKRDRKFLQELVYGALRQRLTLDTVLDAYSKVKVADMERAVRALLRLGTYQLLFLDGVPAYAAITETVSAAKLPAKTRGFVNAVLRTLDRECRRVPKEKDRGGASARKRLDIFGRKVAFFSRDVFADPAADPVLHVAQVTSHPEALVARLVERFDKNTAQEILARNNRVAPLSARANQHKISRDDLLERLRKEGIRCRAGVESAAVRLEVPPTELVRSKAFREGLCTIQDETSMKVAPALDPQAGETVLDLCAAPGGKASHLAELTGDQATVVALDRDGERLDLVRENLLRLQLKSVSVVEQDATAHPSLPEGLPQTFDRVLLDAPCSNTGVLARRPEARWRFDEAHIKSLVVLQRSLLRAAASWTRPGGRLVHSTCSLEPEENLLLVQAFLEGGVPFRLLKTEETLPSDDGDGGFYAVLERTAQRS